MTNARVSMTPEDKSPNPNADRYGVHYGIYGCSLDVDALLAEVRPRLEFKVWRRGDTDKDRKRAESSGIKLDVFTTSTDRGMCQALEAFLQKELNILRAAATFTGEGIWSVLDCRMSVYSQTAGKLWLPLPVLRQLAELEIEVEVNAYPCADREGP